MEHACTGGRRAGRGSQRWAARLKHVVIRESKSTPIPPPACSLTPLSSLEVPQTDPSPLHLPQCRSRRWWNTSHAAAGDPGASKVKRDPHPSTFLSLIWLQYAHCGAICIFCYNGGLNKKRDRLASRTLQLTHFSTPKHSSNPFCAVIKTFRSPTPLEALLSMTQLLFPFFFLSFVFLPLSQCEACICRWQCSGAALYLLTGLIYFLLPLREGRRVSWCKSRESLKLSGRLEGTMSESWLRVCHKYLEKDVMERLRK